MTAPGDPHTARAASQPDIPDRLLPLLEGERRALDLIKARKPITLGDDGAKNFDPKAAAEWGEERQLRAQFLEWLLSESELCKQLPASWLGITGAKINGPID